MSLLAPSLEEDFRVVTGNVQFLKGGARLVALRVPL